MLRVYRDEEMRFQVHHVWENIMSGKRRYKDLSRYLYKNYSLSCSVRAELQFSLSHMYHLLQKGCYVQCLTLSITIFLTGIFEYLAANILELVNKEAHNHHKMYITSEHIKRAVDTNLNFSHFFVNNTYT